MNQIDFVYDLHLAGVSFKDIAIGLAVWSSEDEVRDFFHDYVRVNDIEFGQEEEDYDKN